MRDDRYVYVRNYAPHRVHGQFVSYMFQTPTTRVWKALYDAGRLEPAQRRFWETKPPEELYDLAADPDEVRDLAADFGHAATLARLRGALRDHLFAVRDLGFLPEPELHARTGGGAPYDLGRDDARYPLAQIVEMADLATRTDVPAVPELTAALGHADSAVRYWGAVGLLARGGPAVEAARPALRAALGDPSASVQVTAAEALGRFGAADDLDPALDLLLARASLDDNDLFTAVLALNALDYLDERAAGAIEAIRALPREQAGMRRQFRSYVPQLIDKALADLEP